MLYTGICLFGMSRVTFDNDIFRLLQSDKMEFKVLGDDLEHLERTNLIVVEGEDLLTAEAIAAIHSVTQQVADVQGVETVYSILNVRGDRRAGRYLLPLFIPGGSDASLERARRLAPTHPLLVGHLLSDDWRTTLVIVELDESEVRQILGSLQQVLNRWSNETGLTARITGPAALGVDIFENMRGDIGKLSLLGIGVVLIIAIVMFRSVGAVLIVASGPAVGAIWTIGTLGLIGEPINMLTNVVPVLVLVIGFTDSMHLVLHMRKDIAHGSTTLEAAQNSVQHLGLACALTSLSTAVGFGSLVLASIYVIKIFGWTCAMGSVLSFLAVITVVPLVASTQLGKHLVANERSSRQPMLEALADKAITGLLARPYVVLVCGLVVTFALALLVTRLEPDHRIANEISHASESFQALQHVDKTFGGILFAYAVVHWPEARGPDAQEFYDVLEEVHHAFSENQVLENPLSFLNLIKSLPDADESLPQRAARWHYIPEDVLQRFVDLDGQRAVVSAHIPDVGARRLNPAFDEVERRFSRISARHSGYHVELASAQVSAFRSVHLMIEDLWTSLLTAAGVIFLMIWIGLQSIRYALASVIPNVFPLLCAGALIVLSGRYLEMSSVIVFSISLGIAVDDTIHVLVRFRRELNLSGEPRLAVRRTLKSVGAVLVMTTIALVAGHSIVVFSAFPAVQIFGIVTAVTIASALVGDLVILPAILACPGWLRGTSGDSST
jgi:hypothetical protein